jgi:3-phenylpropionate/cinnamic acid dioxygenase small subunit
MATDRDTALTRLLLKAEAEAFFAEEADLLDSRRFEDWLGLLAPEVKVWMPMARNIETGGDGLEFTVEDADANWLDEGYETLEQRVKQLATGVHWAEQPPSRTTHMVSNVEIIDMDGPLESPERLMLRCRFLLYRNRNEAEQDFFVGKRNDTLRRVDGDWRLARREIFLDQNVLLAKNLSVFF